MRGKQVSTGLRANVVGCFLNIAWQDTVTNSIVPSGDPSVYGLLKRRRVHWLGRVLHVKNGWISKVFSRVLVLGMNLAVRSKLCYKCVL